MTTPKLPTDLPLKKPDQRPACDPCDLRAFARNRWFDGKLLTTRDLEDEQDYLRGKDRLHSSLAHGTGTVCGLKVTEHPNPACQHQYVVLNPGLAYDCCGHEIVVPERTTVDLRDLIEDALRARQRFNDGNPAPANIYLRLAYRESDTEPVPALLDDCGCDTPPMEHNRTREGYELLVDLDEPAHAVSEPLEAGLEWRNTLSVGAPAAMLVDRILQRLYIAEWDGQGWLRTYETEHHSLLSRAALGELRPTALACSSGGDFLYIAGPGTDSTAAIAIVEQQQLESSQGEPVRATLALDASVVRLEVALRDHALLAVLDDGRILRWADETLRAWSGKKPAPDPLEWNLRELLKAESSNAVPGHAVIRLDDFAPADTAQTWGSGGYWLVVADKNNPRLVVLNLAQLAAGGRIVANLIKSFPLREGDIPTAVEFSHDGKYLYVLCGQSRMLYRIEVRGQLDTFIPLVSDEQRAFSALPLCDSPDPNDQNPPKLPDFRDLSIAPRDSWAYLLCTDPAAPKERGQVMIVSTEGMGGHIGEINQKTAPTLRNIATSTLGEARCQLLAFSGQRLYVAGDTIGNTLLTRVEPTAGSVSIIDIEEDDCGAYVKKTIEGCPTCDGEDGVIIASIRGYQWNQGMVEHEPEPGTAGKYNLIDNKTYRPVAPSTDTLRQMIECVLKKGISEGVPGPRGPQGLEGRQGPAGRRGPGITAVDVTTLTADEEAAAQLLEIPRDPEHDQTLRLGIPRGSRIAKDVSVETLDPGGEAWAQLDAVPSTPFPVNPEADLKLNLGIPRGQPGEAWKPEELNQITDASWHHDEVMTPETFVVRFGGRKKLGLVIVFERPVRVNTLTERSFFMRLRRREDIDISGSPFCESELFLYAQVEPLNEPTTGPVAVKWLKGPMVDPKEPLQSATDGRFELVTDAASPPSQRIKLVSAARLVLPDAMSNTNNLKTLNLTRVEVVVRGDWVLDDTERPLDGNGNGTGGGDWISLIHLVSGSEQ